MVRREGPLFVHEITLGRIDFFLKSPLTTATICRYVKLLTQPPGRVRLHRGC